MRVGEKIFANEYYEKYNSQFKILFKIKRVKVQFDYGSFFKIHPEISIGATYNISRYFQNIFAHAIIK